MLRVDERAQTTDAVGRKRHLTQVVKGNCDKVTKITARKMTFLAKVAGHNFCFYF